MAYKVKISGAVGSPKTYGFRNKDTDEITEVLLKESELDDFIADNPHLSKVDIVGMPLIGSGRAGKPSDHFRSVLKEMKKENPNSTIETF